MPIKLEFLKNIVLSDIPINWLVHAQGFFNTGKKLIETPQSNYSKYVSTEYIFNQQYSYKIAIYLLSHSIELLLKAYISAYNKNTPSAPLQEPTRYSHHVKRMFDDLVNNKLIAKEKDDEKVIALVDIYLKWFGRYYCPNKNDIERTLTEDYVENEEGLVEFKHKLTSDTHKKLIVFYQSLFPPIDPNHFTMQYLLHTPF